MAKKPKWLKGLSKREIQHLKESSYSGRPSKKDLLKNAEAGLCLECKYIANKITNNSH